MNRLQPLISRILSSSVLWSWILNFLRLASSLILLPLLIQVLPTPELGMYFVFVGLFAIVPLIDFGFSMTLARFVGYAMGGATELKAQGMESTPASGSPNHRLLGQLLPATRRFYAFIALLGFGLLGTAGTLVVAMRVHELGSPLSAWLAWGFTLAAALSEIYLGWWTMFLRGMNEVSTSARISVLGYALNLLLSSLLLLIGLGLLSVPIATLIAGLIQRNLAARACMRLLEPAARSGAGFSVSFLLQILWPNSWRMGTLLLTTYLVGNLIIFIPEFNLLANAEYGLSYRIVIIIAGMAAVWTEVKWPLVTQLRAQGRFAEIAHILRPRFLLQFATFGLLAGVAITFGPGLLRHWTVEKTLLPTAWFSLMALNIMLQLQFTFWTTMLATENRIPSFRATILSNVLSVLASVLLLQFSDLGVGALILPPLLVGLAFNYWYWAWYGAKSLRTTWLDFLLARSS
ncbi:MAG: hypothetical protein AB1813_22420 [Verrucomicrobiota bacterium]|jgi:hypothetical protein